MHFNYQLAVGRGEGAEYGGVIARPCCLWLYVGEARDCRVRRLARRALWATVLVAGG